MDVVVGRSPSLSSWALPLAMVVEVVGDTYLGGRYCSRRWQPSLSSLNEGLG